MIDIYSVSLARFLFFFFSLAHPFFVFSQDRISWCYTSEHFFFRRSLDSLLDQIIVIFNSENIWIRHRQILESLFQAQNNSSDELHKLRRLAVRCVFAGNFDTAWCKNDDREFLNNRNFWKIANRSLDCLKWTRMFEKQTLTKTIVDFMIIQNFNST